jgi:hypothetical protein
VTSSIPMLARRRSPPEMPRRTVGGRDIDGRSRVTTEPYTQASSRLASFGWCWFDTVTPRGRPLPLHTWPADPRVRDAGDAEVVHDVTYPLQLDLCRSKGR